MHNDIPDAGQESAFENYYNDTRKQDTVGGQQDCALGKTLQSSILREEEDKHGRGKHDVE